jgi:hypothetical protein
VWAIVDCARDRRIHPALRTSGLDHRCLYSGRLSPEVEAAAPHLIEVAPTFTFTPKLIDMGWGNSWFVFLRIDDPSDLRPHLRRFLRVQDESGKILIFRYYDPRVLRVYLPTCRADELRTCLTISSYLVEDQTGQSLIEFSFDGDQLHERRIRRCRKMRPGRHRHSLQTRVIPFADSRPAQFCIATRRSARMRRYAPGLATPGLIERRCASARCR